MTILIFKFFAGQRSKTRIFGDEKELPDKTKFDKIQIDENKPDSSDVTKVHISLFLIFSEKLVFFTHCFDERPIIPAPDLKNSVR